MMTGQSSDPSMQALTGSELMPAWQLVGAVGEMRGRLGTLETRVQRHEEMSQNNFTAMQVKLDTIQTAVTQKDGYGKGVIMVITAMFSIMTAIAGVAVAVFFHH